MSILDILGRIRKPLTPRPPVTPPPPPPLNPVDVAIRIDAMRRRSDDSLRWKLTKTDQYLPPLVPSIEYYISHPDYVWSPSEPNPERPEKPPEPVFEYKVYVNDTYVSSVKAKQDIEPRILQSLAMMDKNVSSMVGKQVTTQVTVTKKDGQYALYLKVIDIVGAQNRQAADMQRYITLQRQDRLRRMVQVPFLNYYLDHPEYKWDPDTPVNQTPKVTNTDPLPVPVAPPTAPKVPTPPAQRPRPI